jgi:thiol:disulfide interchange protein DsbG
MTAEVSRAVSMNPYKKITLALASAFALSAVALSAQAAEPLPPAVQTAVDNGLQFEKSFPAAGGLTGWVLSQGPNNNIVIYTPPSGDVAIAGNMFDVKGVNLNKQYLEKYAPTPDYAKLWGELESSAWVYEGAKPADAKSIIYAFEDANCGYCHLAWKSLLPYMKVGLQVRWIPVAFLGSDSLPKAAALLTATDGPSAAAAMHADYGKRLANPKPVPEATKAKIDANATLMRKYGFTGTPAIFYKDKAGKVIAVTGMPRLNELPAITGLPVQPQTDPDLARYK